MEYQLNVFNKGLKGDLSPAYMDSQSWTFPTVNARFYNNKKGFAAVNLLGNTNRNNPQDEGAEIALKENFVLIGAYEKEGIAFLYSVNVYDGLMEIGTFPSPETAFNPSALGGFRREYSPLMNIKIGQPCTLSNSDNFSWSPDFLLRIEGKVEYDNSVNMYICSGQDLLRVINCGFDVKTGLQLEHRHYNEDDFEEATRVVKTQSKKVTQFKIEDSDIKVLSTGGQLGFGAYYFYFRYIGDTYDATSWILKTPAIMIGINNYGDSEGKYIYGEYGGDKKSEASIEITIPISTAYKEVEVGYIYRTENKLGVNDFSFDKEGEKGILIKKYPIGENEQFKTITITSIEKAMDWDEKENPDTIELIPQDILTMNNVLFQANLSNETVDINILRNFIKRVKVKCHVHHGKLPMPTDEIFLKNIPESTEGIFFLEGIYTLTKSSYTEFYPYLNHDYSISHSPTSNKKGSIMIKAPSPYNLDGEYLYANKKYSNEGFFNGYKYEFDELDYPELIGLSLFGNDSETSFMIKKALEQNYFQTTNVYNKFYMATSDNLTDDDFIMLVDDYKIYVNIDGVMDKEFFYFEEIKDRFNQTYMLYDISENNWIDGSLIIDHEEMRLSFGDKTYLFGENEEIFIQNDGYYSKQEHIMNDVGYFGGEIYAFSLIAQDIYGNLSQPFPVTGIDHYYANKKEDLEYTAYDSSNNYETMLPDEDSDYSINGNRKFVKNQQGIYRFPSRSNYVKTLDANNRLRREENHLNPSHDIEEYNNDIFNLTQRILDGEGSNSQTSIINIFKVSFDFSEAYKWLVSIEQGRYLRLFRDKIMKFIPLRAERTGEADNLIAQGLIQKPNTIVPFPKYYEWSYEYMSENEMGLLGMSTYQSLISYNFECIETFTGLPSSANDMKSLHTDNMKGYSARHLCRGQLGNSAIKMESDFPTGYNDTLYPRQYLDLKDKYNNKILNKKSFIYSGVLSTGRVDFSWDAYYKKGITETVDQDASTTFRMPPSLGAMTYPVVISSSKDVYWNTIIDAVWGELGNTLPDTVNTAGELKKIRFPQQSIFFRGAFSLSMKEGAWYDYDLNVYHAAKGERAEYLNTFGGRRPVKLSGAGLKIPFFKGYMPCVTMADRRSKHKRYRRVSRMFTQRCMYHAYDHTRAFFSPDIIFNKDNSALKIMETEINYIKPLRKTIYSGLEGMTNYGEDGFKVEDESFKADGWKTFLARINVMPLMHSPFNNDETYGDEIARANGYANKQIDVWNNLASFYKPPFKSNSGIRINTNPISLLHSVRKYYNIDSQRECIPVKDNIYLDDRGGFDASKFLGDTEQTQIYMRSIIKDRTDVYVTKAHDFTCGEPAGKDVTLPIGKESKFTKKTSSAQTAYNFPQSDNILYATIETEYAKGALYRGNHITSNRNFKIVPYFALGLDVDSFLYNPSNEYDSLNYDSSDYRYGEDYTKRQEDRFVKLSRIKGYETGSSQWKIDKKNTEFGMGQGENRNGIANQINDKDVYVDTNYEDLTLVNLYKVNPENITDITSFYSYSIEKYFSIGEILSKDVLSSGAMDVEEDRSVVLGRGDCYLDRVYFKHTTWRATNLRPHPDTFGGGGDTPIGNNWEAIGAATNYNNYHTFFTSSTTSYAHGTVVGVIVESKNNYALRGGIDETTMNAYPYTSNMPNQEYGKNLAGNSKMKNLYPLFPHAETSSGLTFGDLYEYNNGYSNLLGSIFHVLANDKVSYLKTRYPNRIRSSHVSRENSYRDAWQQFEIGSFQDFSSEYGEILRLAEYKGNLFSFTRNAIFQHFFEVERAEVTEEQILSIGSPSILSANALRLSDVGLSHKFGMISVESGLYGVDANRETIWKVDGESSFGKYIFSINPINKTLGVNEWTKKYFYDVREKLGYNKDISDITAYLPDNLFNGEGVVVGYDRRYNEVLFTFKNKHKDVTVCYSDLFGFFTSLYTFTPYMYFNINRDLFSLIRRGNKKEGRLIYRHNNEYSDRLKFYNSFYENDFELSVIINGMIGEKNLTMLPKQFQAHIIEAQQEPFTRIIHETLYQKADHLFIQPDEYWSHPEYLSHNWQVPIQIDNTSSQKDYDMFSYDSSMLGDWMKLTLTYKGDSRNEEIFVQSITTSFYISNA